jgi:hypothetical protein
LKESHTEALQLLELSRALPGGFSYGETLGAEATKMFNDEIVLRAERVRMVREAKARADQERARAKARAEEQRARIDAIRAQRWPKEVEDAVIQGKVMIGMTPQQVTLSVGKPMKVNRTIRASGSSEQWVYGQDDYLYFENGRLVTIQTSR